MNGNISFDSNNLQTFNPATGRGIITNSIEHTDVPTKDVQIFELADANGSSIPSITYPSKLVRIAGALKGTSHADLDNLIDTFKSYFNGKEKNLDIAYGSGTRRYIATANAIGISRQQKLPTAIFSIEFICTLPFGIDTTPTQIAAVSGHTTASLTMSATLGGSAPIQLPEIEITLVSITGDGDYIQLSNDDNGQDLLLYGLGLADGDVIKISAADREVTINDVPVDYTGSFFELPVGPVSITYSDGFTDREVDIDINYYKRWL